jgi:hypothetical protein
MWLIRKIVVRRNIAGCLGCIRKVRLDGRLIVTHSERRRFCIIHHKDNTK